MNNIENPQEYKEAQEELYLRHMMHRYVQHYGKSCLNEEKRLPDSPLDKPSKAQVRAIKKALYKQTNPTSKSFNTQSKKIIFRTAILIALLLITLIFSGAHKLNLFSFMAQSREEYTKYSSHDESHTFLLKYIPSGYSEATYDTEGGATQIIYTNDNDANQYFLFVICKSPHEIAVDTENADYIEAITINGNSGEISLKDGLTSIVWSEKDSGTIFLLQSTLSENESLKIAENIYKK